MLFLHGAFSYFSMSKPSLSKLEGKDEIYPMIKEGIRNPGSDTYAKSKEIIMDWDGNITDERDKIQVIL